MATLRAEGEEVKDDNPFFSPTFSSYTDIF